MDEHRDIIGQTARDKNPGAGEQVGEAVGGVSGGLTGAALGSAAGPVGTILGGIAGAVGGWWAGEKVGRAAEDIDDYNDSYQTHFRENRADELDWDRARVGYSVGHIAGHNPDYRGRAFDDVEPDLRDNWNDPDEYTRLRPYVRHSYERNSMR